MADIFISYQRANRDIASSLSKALEGQGWSTWWDRQLIGGENFDDKIEEELLKAKCVIVLWSRLATKSKYVKAEAAEAMEKDKLIPACIEKVKLPLIFKRVHTESLINWDRTQEHEEFQDLVRSLTNKLGPSPKYLAEKKMREELRRAKKNSKRAQEKENRKSPKERSPQKEPRKGSSQRRAKENNQRQKSDSTPKPISRNDPSFKTAIISVILIIGITLAFTLSQYKNKDTSEKTPDITSWPSAESTHIAVKTLDIVSLPNNEGEIDKSDVHEYKDLYVPAGFFYTWIFEKRSNSVAR